MKIHLCVENTLIYSRTKKRESISIGKCEILEAKLWTSKSGFKKRNKFNIVDHVQPDIKTVRNSFNN